MGLDITIYKANKKEWQEYADGKEIDYVYDITEDTPISMPLGYFIGIREFAMTDGVKNCIVTQITKEIFEEIHNNIMNNDKYENMFKIAIDNWFMVVINTLKDDEVILLICDW